MKQHFASGSSEPLWVPLDLLQSVHRQTAPIESQHLKRGVIYGTPLHTHPPTPLLGPAARPTFTFTVTVKYSSPLITTDDMLQHRMPLVLLTLPARACCFHDARWRLSRRSLKQEDGGDGGEKEGKSSKRDSSVAALPFHFQNVRLGFHPNALRPAPDGVREAAASGPRPRTTGDEVRLHRSCTGAAAAAHHKRRKTNEEDGHTESCCYQLADSDTRRSWNNSASVLIVIKSMYGGGVGGSDTSA